jgi:hypothetical protein
MDHCVEEGGKLRNSNLPPFDQLIGRKIFNYELIKEIEFIKVAKLEGIVQVIQYHDHKPHENEPYEIIDGESFACILWEYVDGDNLG